MRKHLLSFFAAPLDALNLRFSRMTNWIQAKSLHVLGQPGNSNGHCLTWGWFVGKTVAVLQDSTARVFR